MQKKKMLVWRCSIFTWLCWLNPVPYSTSKWPFTFGQETTKYELSFLLELGWVSLHNLVKQSQNTPCVPWWWHILRLMDRDCDCVHKRLQQVRQIHAKPCIVTYYNYTKSVTGACDSVSLTSFENWMLLSTCFTKKLTVSTITMTGTIPGLYKWPCQHNLSSTSR